MFIGHFTQRNFVGAMHCLTHVINQTEINSHTKINYIVYLISLTNSFLTIDSISLDAENI
jgi:hypothetical protein